jgi:Rv0078B-related antitoxin
MSNDELAQKLYLTLELHDAGVDMMRQNLRRRYPEATSEDIEAKLGTWLRERPMDAPGKPYIFKHS